MHLRLCAAYAAILMSLAPFGNMNRSMGSPSGCIERRKRWIDLRSLKSAGAEMRGMALENICLRSGMAILLLRASYIASS